MVDVILCVNPFHRKQQYSLASYSVNSAINHGSPGDLQVQEPNSRGVTEEDRGDEGEEEVPCKDTGELGWTGA